MNVIFASESNMQIEENISLKTLNTFGIDVCAAYFSRITSIADIHTFLQHPLYTKVPHIILGGGSNILFTGNYPGWVLKNEISGINLLHEDSEYVYIKASSGENWHRFVQYCLHKGYAGIENLSLIPGNVGAAPMQNIGAYGVEVKDVIEQVETIEKSSSKAVVFSNKECCFGYRSSIFKTTHKDKYIITGVVFRLHKKAELSITYGAIREELEKMQVSQPDIHAVSEAVCHIRRSKLPDPMMLGNAGSFFKNPVVNFLLAKNIQQTHSDVPLYPVNETETKIAAGWLIEKCGWKGKRKGNCGVHEKQALVLVNYGGASGSNILSLAHEITDSVYQKFGIQLEMEVNII